MAGVPLREVTEYLDDYLRIGSVPDYDGAVNGLQVENGGTVGGFIAAVDASQATIDAAIAARDRFSAPPLILVHHGLFWDGNRGVTGRRYRRIGALLRHDIPLYSAHIPLDVHGDVGNNVLLARRLGLEALAPFGDFKGIPVGVQGSYPAGVRRTELVNRIDGLLDTAARVIEGGPEVVRRVGVITGAGGTMVKTCIREGVDTFITGEGAHHTFFDAMEFGINLIYAGHYASEQLGVKAVAELLSTRFGLPWEYHHHPTGL